MRPQYQCASHNFTNEWRPNGTITAALQDPAVVKATCPGSPKGMWLSSLSSHFPVVLEAVSLPETKATLILSYPSTIQQQDYV